MKNREIEKISEAKLERRRELARLPIEKKIEILIELQRMAREVSLAARRKPKWVWYEV